MTTVYWRNTHIRMNEEWSTCRTGTKTSLIFPKQNNSMCRCFIWSEIEHPPTHTHIQLFKDTRKLVRTHQQSYLSIFNEQFIHPWAIFSFLLLDYIFFTTPLFPIPIIIPQACNPCYWAIGVVWVNEEEHVLSYSKPVDKRSRVQYTW